MKQVRDHSFKIKASNELLTDRGGLALFDEYVHRTGILDEIEKVFPVPGSNRGIKASEYFRLLSLHMLDGGRYMEEINEIKTDSGFNKLLNMRHIPGPDAVGDWLRRHGPQALQSDYFSSLCSKLLPLYLESSTETQGYTLDMDASLVESDKGDGTKSYNGTIGYNPMFGFLSNGSHEPFNIYCKFRQGYVSPSSDQLEGIRNSHGLLASHGKRISHLRLDSAGYIADIVNYCNAEKIHYTITADQDVSVRKAIASIAEEAWKPFYDRDGTHWGWEIAETKHIMIKSKRCFRLIVKRKSLEQMDIFGGAYKYYAIISNIPRQEMEAQQVLHFHNGRGNAEKFIEDAKYGLNLKVVPTGQMYANALYYMIGMLVFNLVKLMQLQVLPQSWRHRMITSIRQKLLRTVGRVVSSGHQLWLAIRAPLEKIMMIQQIRDEIYALE